MSLSTLFGFKSDAITDTELPDIFPLDMTQAEFVKTDTFNIYLKILTDVIERTHGLNEEIEKLLWDNCLQSEACDGLITLLARAMSEKQDLFLIYEPAIGVLRRAKTSEATQIKDDYASKGKSDLGVFLSFKNYARTDMVKLYAGLEYCTVSSLNKTLNISKALQLKMSDLRGSTALTDSLEVKNQAKQIATSLSNGKDVLLDAKDVIETATPDLTAISEAMHFLNQKRSFYLGMPASYITGEAPKGLGDSGEGETKAVERGLKAYYFAVMRPVIEALFVVDTNFKSHDFRQIGSALEALKTFELVSDEFLSPDNKRLILNKLLDLDIEQ